MLILGILVYLPLLAWALVGYFILILYYLNEILGGMKLPGFPNELPPISLRYQI